MKIVEALKKIKYLKTKVTDLTKKIREHCCDYDNMEPIYKDQQAQVMEWVQSCEDTIKEVLRLNIAIQRTNLETSATVQLAGKPVVKTIAEWIHRRRDLADTAKTVWTHLNEKGNKNIVGVMKEGKEDVARLRLYFDPKERDKKIGEYNEEPSLIDGVLEVTNAVTDLIE